MRCAEVFLAGLGVRACRVHDALTKGFASPALLPEDLELKEMLEDDLVSLTTMCSFFSGTLRSP